VDEFRPGNFVFYDLMQHQIGSCAVSDIAVALACPVVAIHDDRSELVVYGGGVHLSKDRMEEQGRTIYGKLVQKTKEGWGDLISGAYVKSVSQEHGIISVMPEDLVNYQIGDYVLIIPVHSCMTADLMRGYTVLDNSLPSGRKEWKSRGVK
jgi:D-serine deaminase-like pyridoxal phosphate-dependent protein